MFMTDTGPFAQLLLVISLAAVAAVLSNRLTARLRVPAPALFLAASAVAVALPGLGLGAPPERMVERIVTVALLLSLIHISEPTRRTPISYAVFCLKKKKHPRPHKRS